MDIHKQLEEGITKFVGQGDAILFSSGFGANAGLLRTILGKNDIAYIDSYIHTSATSGIIGTNVKHIGHNDIDLNTEQEQKRIDRAIESLGHMIFHYQELNDYKRTVSEKLKEKGISDVIIKECLVK